MHVVGWRQSYNPANAIDRQLTNSETGLYYQDAHPLLTLDNIAASMPDEWGLQYSPWNMVVPYHKGEKVRHDGIVWIAKMDNTGEEPTASDFNDDYSREDYGNPYWHPYNQLTDYLYRLTQNGIATTVQTFLKTKQLSAETRNILERRTFFDGAGRIGETLDNKHRLVGFEIVPVRSMGVTAKIERVGLQMTGGTGGIRLYLFHSSLVDPVAVYNLYYDVKNGGFQWFTLQDCYLPYIGTNNAGGSWFLCYNQDELPRGVRAINFARDWSREPCGTCNNGGIENWRELTKYIQVSPFVVPAPTTFEEFPEMWDIAQTMYTNTRNYGLNIEISVGCDLTDFIISQRDIFKDVLQKQVAAIALRTIAMNPSVRVNRNQSNVSRMDILYELDGNTAGKRPSGLGYELAESYKALRIDTRGLDRICLSCNNRGVRYRTV